MTIIQQQRGAEMWCRQPRLVLILLLLVAVSGLAVAKEKVILDNDMGELNDDAYALFMMLNSPKIDLLGVTTTPGNSWQEEAVAYSLRHLEMLGRSDVRVVRGVAEPILGLRTPARLEAEERLFGKVMYLGAYSRPRPKSFWQLPQPPYGGYAKTRPAEDHAVDFLVRQIKRHPHEVTLLMIGPTTNLALAMRKDPEIVPLVKRVVYMGGAFEVPGNTSPAAEFNWWFDPEAARITLRTPFPEQIVVPLDICEKVFYTREVYERIIAKPETPIVRMFKDLQGPEFAKAPKQTTFAWDSLAAAIIIEPQLATRIDEFYADVDVNFGPNYGRSLGYRACERRDLAHAADFPEGTQKVHVLMDINRQGFWDLFVTLMTAQRPAAAREGRAEE
jgi:inosine-uridine nucleoside N-ribohydrolase